MQGNPINASRYHFIAIFTFALATIAFQILLTRFLSVILYYHMAFAGITFAMLGLTGGALAVFTNPDKFADSRINSSITRYGISFAVSFTVAVLCLANGSLWNMAIVLPLGLCIVFLLYAFFCSGVCVTLLLTKFQSQTGKLYAADLTGAAMGCIVTILILKFIDPFAAVLLIAFGVALISLMLAPGSEPQKHKTVYRLLVIALLIGAVTQAVTYMDGHSAIKVTWAKGELLETPLFERWNTYSRIDVIERYKGAPYGWGFGIDHSDIAIDQKMLRIDADACTVLTRFNGDKASVSYLKDDIINLGYHVRPVDSVAVIGVGGGRDVLSALTFDAKHIKGIELNPAIIEALTDKFADFTGHLDRMPQVTLVNAEARAYLNSVKETYDLIQISLIDTWAATAAGGLTLAENKLYTVEAWQDFMDKLHDNGMLVVSRWFEPVGHEGELYRMLAIASSVLKDHLHVDDPRRHMLAATVNGVVTVIVSKKPFSDEEIARFNDTASHLHLTVLLSPTVAYNTVTETIASGKADSNYYASLPLDVSPSTDDRPFFFNMVPLYRLLSAPSNLVALSKDHTNDIATKVLFFVAVITFIASIWMIGRPLLMAKPEQRKGLAAAVPYFVYFACIGLGFMYIEISQMQRLMIFLGHPVYGLSVVLFTLLFFGGLGSYTVDSKRTEPAYALKHFLMLLIVLAAIGLVTPWIMQECKHMDTFARIILSVLMIAPAGFCMGWLFPLGIGMAQKQHNHLLPWFWGANGAASVFASATAVIVSLDCGIAFTYWVGVSAYAGCTAMVIYLLQKSNSSAF